MEKTVHVKLRNWDLIPDEQREAVSTRLARWGWHQENRQEGGTDWRREKR